MCFFLNVKKASVVPVLKKGEKQTLKNERPISLRPSCGKGFEWLIHFTCMNFSLKIAGSHQNQFEFKQGDWYINQLVSTTHCISKSFHEGHKIRFFFVDISLAFDKVRHEGLLFEPKRKRYIW